MKNLKLGFVILIIVVVALLVIGGGVYLYTNNKVEAPANVPDVINTLPTSTNSVSDKSSFHTQEEQTQARERALIKTWMTKQFSSLGFEVSFPSDWKIIETASFVRIVAPSSIKLIETENGMDDYIEFLVGDGLCNETNVWSVGYGSLSTKFFKTFCPTNSNINRVFMSASADNMKRVEEMIVATISELPKIYFISPTSGPVGTEVTITGRNMNGFEGDMDAWIQTGPGEVGLVGFLQGTNLGSSNGTQTIRVKIDKLLCENAGFVYSGIPCSNFTEIKPGIHYIYISPWGKESNRVKFTVTD